MSTTKPIKQQENIEKLKDFFLNQNRVRDYTLVTIGLNTALRISDILTLRWKDVYHFDLQSFYMYIEIREQKTGKQKQILLNEHVLQAFTLLLEEENNLCGEDYIFRSRKGNRNAISRVQAYRIIHDAGHALGFEMDISCHSLRKSFGYHAWKQGAEPALIMNIYNHSSYQITKRYLCIDQDDRDALYRKINL